MSETPELQAAVERLTFETLLPQIRTRIETLRIAQASAEKTGQKAIAKWYEGQADALERVHGEMEVCHIRAQQELVELRKDKERLDWLENQATLAFWSGTFSDSDFNAKLGRVGAPICTLSTMDADGEQSEHDEIGSGGSFRQAIDAAIQKAT